MSDLEELTDEERMMNLLEELQRENDRLKAQQQPLEPLLQTIRQQEQEITRLNSSLIGERQQNEKLLELAKNEKKLHEENEKLRSANSQMNERRLSYEDSEKLKNENYSLRQRLQQSESDRKRIQEQLNTATTVAFPDESLLKHYIAALKGADDKSRDIMLVHCINLAVVAVVAVFVVLAIGSGYLSYSANKAAEQANNAVQNGIYDKDGWSMVQEAYLNEYTAYTQRPEWYARYKAQNPEQAHY